AYHAFDIPAGACVTEFSAALAETPSRNNLITSVTLHTYLALFRRNLLIGDRPVTLHELLMRWHDNVYQCEMPNGELLAEFVLARIPNGDVLHHFHVDGPWSLPSVVPVKTRSDIEELTAEVLAPKA